MPLQIPGILWVQSDWDWHRPGTTWHLDLGLEWSRGATQRGKAFGVAVHQPAKADSSRRFCHAHTKTTAPMDKVSTLIAISMITPPVSTER